ncbi:EsaB/YukD family protein [Streptomyces panaciradicis]|uniref:EsaB/YukD family protein n=1 Tax=Streptomyces panaciradicis TaxID=1470261 RepID=UPI00201CB10B|nr:EsaB/YukD family protein [Streptomyces panaciradicis]MCL6671245.1 EsaB/YukD family protein [Streptomyces panaciradicis]
MISTGASSRTGLALSRVTLVGERRRVELVLPSREPVARLLPEVLRLLDPPASARPQTRYLVAADGSVLGPDATLESAGVVDGAVLRLVRGVADGAAADLDVPGRRWGATAGRAVAGCAVVAWASGAALLARREFDAAEVGAVLLVVALLAALAGALFARVGDGRGVSAVLVVAGGALAVFGVWSLADAQGWSGALRFAGVAGVAAVFLALLGWCSPLGRTGFVGAVAVLGGALCWEAAVAVAPVERAGALLGVVSVVALGLLSRFALTASGLSGLDDRRSGASSVSRYQVSTALAATHRDLSLATYVTAGSAAVGGVLVLRTVNGWTVTLALALALVLGLRARACPLVPDVVAVFAAGGVVAVRLAWVWADRGGAGGAVAALVAAAVGSLSVLVVRPTERMRTRMRRCADAFESAGVIVLLPLLVGVFGVYGRLLGTFA